MSQDRDQGRGEDTMKQGRNQVEEKALDKSQVVPSQEKPSMADRLLAMSANDDNKVDRGKWLADKMEELKKSKGIDSDEEPTEAEITMQLKLPGKTKVEMNEYKEPLKKWITVENSGVPSWKIENLLEEEREPGWVAPTPPSVDRSLQLCKGEFVKETLFKISEVVKDKENVLRQEDLADDDEVVIFNNFCIIRTTKAGILKSKKDRRNEEEEDEIEFTGMFGFGGGRGGRVGGGRGRGDGGRGRGKDRCEGKESRGFMRNRSISSSPGRDAGGYRSQNNDGSRQERRDGHPSHGRRGEEDRRAGERREHDRSDYEGKRSGGRRESYVGNRDGGGGSSAPVSYKEYKARKSGGGGR